MKRLFLLFLMFIVPVTFLEIPRVDAFLLSGTNDPDKILRFDETTGTFIDDFVSASSGGLDDPLGLTIGPNGNLYVSSRWTDNVLRYDGTTGDFIDVFIPSGTAGLDTPHGLIFGPDGNLYVSNNRGGSNWGVLRFDGTTGAYIDKFAFLYYPTDLIFGPDGNLYVSSSSDSAVYRFDGATGASIDVFVSRGSGGLSNAQGLAFGPDGNLYVGSYNTSSVLRYNGTTGQFIDVFASGGGLNLAVDVVFGPDGNLYVSGTRSSNIVRYNGTTGEFIDEFVPTGTAGLSSHHYIIFTSQYPSANNPPVSDAGPDQTVPVGTAVTLDGSSSYDPDENYPLDFSWEFVTYPGGSPPILADADTANPTFNADLLGDYIIELSVTDNLGEPSVADTVTVSTFNTAPTADAGSDQVILAINTLVELDGTQSYDLDDGDVFAYEWTIVTRPFDSEATLDDPTSPMPTFVADVHGDYEISLVVTDSFDEVGDPDAVLVSFENVPPVADPGDNQAVVAGDSVFLDGSGSSDANGDSITYSWSFVSVPDGSGAVLSDPNMAQTTFVADVAGTYIVSLTVDDGFGGDDTANVTIVASSVQDELVQALQDMITTINGFGSDVFKNRNMQNALTNKINAVLGKIDQGLYQEALDKLENDILGKTDGCALTGAPGRNDWIKTCTEQEQVYPLVMLAIDLLNSLIDLGG